LRSNLSIKCFAVVVVVVVVVERMFLGKAFKPLDSKENCKILPRK